ncbi:MAG: hypothetical protein WDN44_14135 [Sphingomonas sp.]
MPLAILSDYNVPLVYTMVSEGYPALTIYLTLAYFFLAIRFDRRFLRPAIFAAIGMVALGLAVSSTDAPIFLRPRGGSDRHRQRLRAWPNQAELVVQIYLPPVAAIATDGSEGAAEEMRSEAEEKIPEPRRPFQGLLDRAHAGIAGLNAAADASTAESMRRLRRIFAPFAFLDSPWWLLVSVPALPGLNALGDFAFLPDNMTLAMAVALAGRRWGTAVLTPTLLLCLLELVEFRWLQGFGDLATIPLLLVAARVGYDPGFLAALQRCTALSRIDYLLLSALVLVSYWRIVAFEPNFNIFARTNSILVLTFLLLGAANVSRRVWLCLVTGFAAQLLLAPLDWSGPFVEWHFGTLAVGCLTCIALFEAGRAVRAGRDGPNVGFAVAAAQCALCLIFLMFAVFQARLQYPSLNLQLNGTRVTSFSETLAPPMLVVTLAVSAWCRVRQYGRLALVFLALMGVALFAFSAPAGSLAPQLPKPGGGGFALFVDHPSRSPVANAVALLLLCAGTIFAVERWQPRTAQPHHCCPDPSRLRFWAGSGQGRPRFRRCSFLRLRGPLPWRGAPAAR